MKKLLILTLYLLLTPFVTSAEKLIFIPTNESNNVEILFNDHNLKIHYYCDDYVVATAKENMSYEGSVMLDENPFADGKQYAIVYCLEQHKEEYLSKTNRNGKLLYSGNNFLIMQLLSNEFMPAKNDGMIAIRDIEAKLPKSITEYPFITEPDESILEFLSQVSTDSIMYYIQTLQDFITRNCHHNNHIAARDWIMQKYQALGLDVALHNFNWTYNGYNFNNDNVIAIQRGTEFPDEYVVCGAHYDSFTYESHVNGTFNDAPGADDNASGTAGILETARVLSKYDFKRSIIYCAFSAEEYGLFGSSYYAQKCANEKMNIVGYFNLDMIGFLREGTDIHIDYIYPKYAQPLADYSVQICNVYFPEIPIRQFSSLPWGDSDHTSFNNMGYKGVWPFEDTDCDSPFIHHVAGGTVYGGCSNPCLGSLPCLGDIIGPSVNNPAQVSAFTKAHLACIATLALYDKEIPPPPLDPPTNCKAQYLQGRTIQITWDAPVAPPLKYYVYKDNDSVRITETTNLSYTSTIPLNDFNEHCYKVTSVSGVQESDFSNESCASIPNAITEYNSNFIIYPNPVGNELRITNHELQDGVIEIYDVFGRNVLTVTPFSYIASHSLLTVNISHLPTGIYLIKISNQIIGKFIKE